MIPKRGNFYESREGIKVYCTASHGTSGFFDGDVVNKKTMGHTISSTRWKVVEFHEIPNPFLDISVKKHIQSLTSSQILTMRRLYIRISTLGEYWANTNLSQINPSKGDVVLSIKDNLSMEILTPKDVGTIKIQKEIESTEMELKILNGRMKAHLDKLSS